MADDLTPIAATADIDSFIRRLESADGSEHANYQLFLSALYGLRTGMKCLVFGGFSQC